MKLFAPMFVAIFASIALLHAQMPPKQTQVSSQTKFAVDKISARPYDVGVRLGSLGRLSCDLQTRTGFAALCAFPDDVAAQEKPRGTLTLGVRIEGIKVMRGVVRVALFDKAKGFPNGKNTAIRQQMVEAKAETASVTFADLMPGCYAIAVQHDQNNDSRLNRNTLGIPKERYGFSNNVRGTFGPPSFRAAAFALDANRTMTVKVK